MPNVRPLNEKKYGIGKYRFRELYYHCLQYKEWKDELKYNTNAVQSPKMTGSVISGKYGDSTALLAERRIELQKKCELIEQTAIEADPDIYPYIIKGVTNDWVTYNYLKNVMNIPCGKDLYYERRKRFYYLLSKKM